MVATDIAARGIDIDQLPFVVNFDLPNIPESYVHRIGRTGRAGNTGLAISFCDTEERAYWKDIMKLTQSDVKVIEDHPYVSDVAHKPEKKFAGEKRESGKISNKSRKSVGSKQNKKRWY